MALLIHDETFLKDVMSHCRSILLLAAALLSVASAATVADVRQSAVLTEPAVETQPRAIQQPASAVKTLKGLRGLLGSTKRPEWWPLVECVFLDNVNKCLQDGTVRNLVGLGRKDEVVIDEEKEIVKIPGEEEAGLFDVIGDLVSDGFSRFFSTGKKDSGDDSEEEDSEETSAEEYEDGGSTEEVEDQEDSNEVAQGRAIKGSLHDSDLARGHKKKKKKWKRAFFKLVLMGLLVKLKIAKLIFIATKLIQFKAFLLYVVNTVVNILRLYNEFKKNKKKDNPVLYYEQAQHHHLYDEHHHVDPWSSYPVEENPEDKGWLGGLWSRSGGRKIYPPGQAHDLAYSAYKPEQAVATMS